MRGWGGGGIWDTRDEPGVFAHTKHMSLPLSHFPDLNNAIIHTEFLKPPEMFIPFNATMAVRKGQVMLLPITDGSP